MRDPTLTEHQRTPLLRFLSQRTRQPMEQLYNCYIKSSTELYVSISGYLQAVSMLPAFWADFGSARLSTFYRQHHQNPVKVWSGHCDQMLRHLLLELANPAREMVNRIHHASKNRSCHQWSDSLSLGLQHSAIIAHHLA